jgi:hypothetical protein
MFTLHYERKKLRDGSLTIEGEVICFTPNQKMCCHTKQNSDLFLDISILILNNNIRFLLARSLVNCVVICRSLSLCPFSFGYCVVCPSSIHRFWLPLLVSSNASYKCRVYNKQIKLAKKKLQITAALLIHLNLQM